MKQYELYEKLTQLFYDCLVPIIILVSMAVVGSILDGLLGGEGWFKYIFTGMGGVPLLIVYYIKKGKKYITENINCKGKTTNDFAGVLIKIAAIAAIFLILVIGINYIFNKQEYKSLSHIDKV
ncbi:MAG: hypothetical protein OIN89_01250 [Candidatus Methanoperedens sp.]|jgi:hypothetical protein|nr:hypothetical protein [Candidatus Methanoperedens sp.]PKL54523.1 MAG: hypothetical protein CVV36_01240 [Candidatus Methanoperedenaceae archaeon HGW-Methanoperedenaceae-1]